MAKILNKPHVSIDLQHEACDVRGYGLDVGDLVHYTPDGEHRLGSGTARIIRVTPSSIGKELDLDAAEFSIVSLRLLRVTRNSGEIVKAQIQDIEEWCTSNIGPCTTVGDHSIPIGSIRPNALTKAIAGTDLSMRYDGGVWHVGYFSSIGNPFKILEIIGGLIGSWVEYAPVTEDDVQLTGSGQAKVVEQLDTGAYRLNAKERVDIAGAASQQLYVLRQASELRVVCGPIDAQAMEDRINILKSAADSVGLNITIKN